MNAEEVTQAMNEANTTRKNSFEFRHHLADGTIRDVAVTSGRFYVQDQELLYSVVHDITDRKRYERQLRDSEEKFRLLFEKSPYAHVLYSLEDGYLGCNQAAVDLLGLTCREDILELQPADLSPPFQEDGQASAIKAKRLFDQALAEGSLQFEWTCKRRDGQAIYLEILLNAISLDGRPATHSVWRDITQRKADERERSILLSAIEQADEVIVLTDTEANIRYVNPAFERVTGYPREEAIGQNPRILQSGQHDAEFYREMWATLTAGETWRGQFLNRRKDGTDYTELAVISPVKTPAGRLIAYVAVKRDITEELLLQERLQQSQKMESVGRLAGGVAHDFNNMLFIILGYTEMLLGELPPGHELHQDFMEIHKAASRSADLTKQLLAFSRKQTTQPRQLDLNSTIEAMLAMLRRRIGEAIKLHWTPGEDLPPIHIAPSQVDQLLANLIVNARDAIDHSGEIHIATEAVELDAECCEQFDLAAPGQFIHLSTRDTGRGMDAETRDKIFEPFFTTKPLGEGTGLGLATVYGIVQQNRGVITVESTPGQGSCFHIYLPAAVESAEASGSTDTPRIDSSAEGTILLVEDEQAVLTLTRTLLSRAGYTVLPAATCREAIEQASRPGQTIDLLIADVIMPTMNGLELSRKILAYQPNCKVLFISGFNPEVLGEQDVLAEEMNFLAKPFSEAGLNRAVRQAMNG